MIQKYSKIMDGVDVDNRRSHPAYREARTRKTLFTKQCFLIDV